MDVAGQFAFGSRAHEAADAHVLADLADQGGTGFFHRAAIGHRQGRQGSHVGGVLLEHQLRCGRSQGEEVVVLGNEVGFAVHLEDDARLAVGSNFDGHDALGSHTRGSLVGLGAQLDAQDFLGALHVAVGLGECLLALHHRCIGLLAQRLDHACGNFRHVFLSIPVLEFKWHDSRDAQGDTGCHVRPARAVPRRPVVADQASSSVPTSTNSSSSVAALTVSCRRAALPSRMASATPRAYRRTARPESSLPGMT